MNIKTLLIMSLIIAFSVASFAKSPTADDYFYKATRLYIIGDFDRALESVQTALRLNPKHAGALKLKKSILREEEVLPRALAKIPTRDYLLSVAALSIGSLFLALLLSFLLIVLTRVFLGRRGREDKALLCLKCKARLPKDIEFCPSCGTRVGLEVWHAVSEEQKLWYAKMGWLKNPFSLDINFELFTGYKKEVKEILEKVSARSGHILIVGQLGIGKTTLLRWLAAYLPQTLKTIYIPRPPQQFSQLISYIVDSLGFSRKDVSAFDIYNLEKLRHRAGKNLVLLLDEAHEFTVEVERPLRTLGDLDGVTLVMAGLPETVTKLKNEIRPLFERLVLTEALRPLEFAEFKDLIKARVENAGGKGTHPFTGEALEKIYQLSNGVPRPALKLGDAAVTLAINLGEDKIDVGLIKEKAVLRE